jgi:hypothetical protein
MTVAPTNHSKEHQVGSSIVSAAKRRGTRCSRRYGLASLLALLAALLAIPSAAQAVPFLSFSASLSNTQAGAHPDLALNIEVAPEGQAPPTTMRTLVLELPPGLVGDPQAVAKCSPAQLVKAACPLASQIGAGGAHADFGGVTPLRIFNLEAPANEPARIGVGIDLGGGTELFGPAGRLTVRTGDDYGVTATIPDLPNPYQFRELEMTLWGIPADHNGSGAERAPYMANPSTCGVPLDLTARLNGWGDPAFDSATASLGTMTGCELLPLEADVTTSMGTHWSDAAGPLVVAVSNAQNRDPDAWAATNVDDVSVMLPEGFSINPSAAHDLVACSDAAFDKGGAGASACPGASEVGTVTIDTPLLAEEMPGTVFIGEPQPGNMYRLFVYVEGSGVRIKLEGKVGADPRTGRLTTTFLDNPQLPFETLTMRLRGGPRALIATPASCGTFATEYEISGWSGASVAGSSPVMAIDQGCGPFGFAPGFAAGTEGIAAGGSSPFVAQITREPGQPSLSTVDVDLPAGLLGAVSKVTECAAAAAAAGTCGPESRVGGVTVGAGAGSHPFYLPGQVFLTEGYKDAPFGLSIVVPAKAGPYDLGTVVVRAAMAVDPDTAEVSVDSDPLPQILEGVPLRLRDVRISVDRAGFMRLPTSCAATEVAGRIAAVTGATADVDSPFQVANCASLGFTPKLAMRLIGKAQRAAGKHPGLRAVLTQSAGQAGIEQVKVKLPKSLALDAENAHGLCGYEQGLKADCPAGSKIGTATAVSPLLDRPLSGPVYFVEGVRFDKRTGNRIRTTPTLLVKLGGQIALNLRAKSSASGGRLVTTFAAVPDAPVSKFSLRLKGGDGGILAVTGDRHLCSSSRVASVQTDGHNGKRRDYLAAMKAPCGKRKRGARR